MVTWAIKKRRGVNIFCKRRKWDEVAHLLDTNIWLEMALNMWRNELLSMLPGLSSHLPFIWHCTTSLSALQHSSVEKAQKERRWTFKWLSAPLWLYERLWLLDWFLLWFSVRGKKSRHSRSFIVIALCFWLSMRGNDSVSGNHHRVRGYSITMVTEVCPPHQFLGRQRNTLFLEGR